MTERSPEIHDIPDEADMLALGARLADGLADGLGGGRVVYLSGPLGAGKTTLVRGMLRGLGFEGRVKSPSYGLVESYALDGLAVHHLDLYRLADPGEIEFLGLEDLLADDALLLVEWPERGIGALPPADTEIRIDMAGEGRSVQIESG